MRNTYQNIPNRVIEIDTKFARIISSVTNNQYNPGYLYDMANKIYGNKQIQQNDFVHAIPPVTEVQPIQKNIKKQKQVEDNLIKEASSQNKFGRGNDYASQGYVNFPVNNKQRQRQIKFKNTSLTAAVASSRLIHDQEKSIYTGQFNSQNYVRYIDTKTLGQISQLALQRYNKISTTGNNSVYNGDPSHSPYQPIPVPSSITQLLKMTQAIKSGGVAALAGLGQYYFGGRMRIGRTAAQTKTGAFGFQLTSFIAYNTFRGIFLNMTPTPMSFSLGFDIPLIGPLAINVVGGFGAGGFKSQYTDDPSTITRDQHSLGTTLLPYSSANKQLQSRIMRKGINAAQDTACGDNFYQLIQQARGSGQLNNMDTRRKWKKRNNRLGASNIASRIIQKFLKQKPGSQDKMPVNIYGDAEKRRYKKLVTPDGQLVDFYRQVDISSPNVILIKINSQMTYGDIGSTLVIPAVIKSISDNNSVQWQDTWNNTGRFQPIKAYMGVTRNVDVTFSVFAYTLFNDVNIRNRRKDATRSRLKLNTIGNFNKNRDRVTINDSSNSYSNLQTVIRRANKQYHQTMRWLKQLTYPIIKDGGIKRFNLATSLTIGQYITNQDVIINSVNITPSQQFYWTYKFPMLVEVSMSFTVFRKTNSDGSISDKLYDTTRTKYTVPGMPSSKETLTSEDFINEKISSEILKANQPDRAKFIKSTATGR